MDELIQKNAIH